MTAIPVHMSKDVDESKLDPAMRGLVMWLRGHGFQTTDSGSGVITPDKPECALDFPHVAMLVDAKDMVDEARRLRTRLQVDLGVELDEVGRGTAWLEASYDATNDIAIIILGGLNSEAVGLA